MGVDAVGNCVLGGFPWRPPPLRRCGVQTRPDWSARASNAVAVGCEESRLKSKSPLSLRKSAWCCWA